MRSISVRNSAGPALRSPALITCFGPRLASTSSWVPPVIISPSASSTRRPIAHGDLAKERKAVSMVGPGRQPARVAASAYRGSAGRPARRGRLDGLASPAPAPKQAGMKQSVKLIAGNWKMNGLGASLSEAEALRADLQGAAPDCRVALCPPATLIERMSAAVSGSRIEVGGQDCRAEESGAYTGDVSAAMLRDAGATLVILGHSERRQGYGETDLLVSAKAEAAAQAGLEPIVC